MDGKTPSSLVRLYQSDIKYNKVYIVFCVGVLKVVDDSEIVSRIINSGRLFRPLKFNNLYSLKNIEVYK